MHSYPVVVRALVFGLNHHLFLNFVQGGLLQGSYTEGSVKFKDNPLSFSFSKHAFNESSDFHNCSKPHEHQASRLLNFFHATQLSTKFILLINVKMPTIVGILTFISMINTSERLKARNFFICRYFSFYEQLKFRAQLS